MEVAGFAGWLMSIALFILYLLWAFIPDETLRWLGFHFYPDRYLAVAIPAWSIVSFLCYSLFIVGLHLTNTAAPDSYSSLVDTASNDLPDKTDWASATVKGTPEIGDFPITLVSHMLYPVRTEEPQAPEQLPSKRFGPPRLARVPYSHTPADAATAIEYSKPVAGLRLRPGGGSRTSSSNSEQGADGDNAGDDDDWTSPPVSVGPAVSLGLSSSRGFPEPPFGDT